MKRDSEDCATTARAIGSPEPLEAGKNAPYDVAPIRTTTDLLNWISCANTEQAKDQSNIIWRA